MRLANCALPGECVRLAEELAYAREDRLRLAHPAHPLLALGELARLGPDQLDAAGAQCLHVPPAGRVLPHPHVHRRCDEERPPKRERELREHVVGEPAGERRERVRRKRGDHEQVGLDQVGVELARLLAAGKRLEGARGDEALCLCGQNRRDLMTGLDEQARQLARLVGGDSTSHPEDNLGHGKSPSS